MSFSQRFSSTQGKVYRVTDNYNIVFLLIRHLYPSLYTHIQREEHVTVLRVTLAVVLKYMHCHGGKKTRIERSPAHTHFLPEHNIHLTLKAILTKECQCGCLHKTTKGQMKLISLGLTLAFFQLRGPTAWSATLLRGSNLNFIFAKKDNDSIFPLIG